MATLDARDHGLRIPTHRSYVDLLAYYRHDGDGAKRYQKLNQKLWSRFYSSSAEHGLGEVDYLRLILAPFDNSCSSRSVAEQLDEAPPQTRAEAHDLAAILSIKDQFLQQIKHDKTSFKFLLFDVLPILSHTFLDIRSDITGNQEQSLSASHDMEQHAQLLAFVLHSLWDDLAQQKCALEQQAADLQVARENLLDVQVKGLRNVSKELRQNERAQNNTALKIADNKRYRNNLWSVTAQLRELSAQYCLFYTIEQQYCHQQAEPVAKKLRNIAYSAELFLGVFTTLKQASNDIAEQTQAYHKKLVSNELRESGFLRANNNLQTSEKHSQSLREIINTRVDDKHRQYMRSFVLAKVLDKHTEKVSTVRELRQVVLAMRQQYHQQAITRQQHVFALSKLFNFYRQTFTISALYNLYNDRVLGVDDHSQSNVNDIIDIIEAMASSEVVIFNSTKRRKRFIALLKILVASEGELDADKILLELNNLLRESRFNSTAKKFMTTNFCLVLTKLVQVSHSSEQYKSLLEQAVTDSVNDAKKLDLLAHLHPVAIVNMVPVLDGAAQATLLDPQKTAGVARLNKKQKWKLLKQVGRSVLSFYRQQFYKPASYFARLKKFFFGADNTFLERFPVEVLYRDGKVKSALLKALKVRERRRLFTELAEPENNNILERLCDSDFVMAMKADEAARFCCEVNSVNPSLYQKLRDSQKRGPIFTRKESRLLKKAFQATDEDICDEFFAQQLAQELAGMDSNIAYHCMGLLRQASQARGHWHLGQHKLSPKRVARLDLLLAQLASKISDHYAKESATFTANEHDLFNVLLWDFLEHAMQAKAPETMQQALQVFVASPRLWKHCMTYLTANSSESLPQLIEKYDLLGNICQNFYVLSVDKDNRATLVALLRRANAAQASVALASVRRYYSKVQLENILLQFTAPVLLDVCLQAPHWHGYLTNAVLGERICQAILAKLTTLAPAQISGFLETVLANLPAATLTALFRQHDMQLWIGQLTTDVQLSARASNAVVANLLQQPLLNALTAEPMSAWVSNLLHSQPQVLLALLAQPEYRSRLVQGCAHGHEAVINALYKIVQQHIDAKRYSRLDLLRLYQHDAHWRAEVDADQLLFERLLSSPYDSAFIEAVRELLVDPTSRHAALVGRIVTHPELCQTLLKHIPAVSIC